MSHGEHDTVYVKDYACRSFSVATLRAMIEVVLENMPAGWFPSNVQFAVSRVLPNVYHYKSAIKDFSLQSVAGCWVGDKIVDLSDLCQHRFACSLRRYRKADKGCA